jgi:hypothetical protein
MSASALPIYIVSVNNTPEVAKKLVALLVKVRTQYQNNWIFFD